MAYDDDNLFAKIMRGEIPCHKVYEDGDSFAFLDIMPRAPGHTLVLPKAKAENLLDISEEALTASFRTVRMLAPKIVEAMNADGFMLQQFNGEGAGQTVFHLHIHIVPRTEGVPLKSHASGKMADNDWLAEIAEKIRATISP